MLIQNLSRLLVVLAALALLFSLTPYSILGQSDVGTLRVAIRDKASGQIVPAMICITSLADNTWRQPPDGRAPASFLKNIDFIQARWKSIEYIAGPNKKWFPGDPGPGLVMNGTYPDQITRDLWYYGGPAIPFWKEPAA